MLWGLCSPEGWLADNSKCVRCWHCQSLMLSVPELQNSCRHSGPWSSCPSLGALGGQGAHPMGWGCTAGAGDLGDSLCFGKKSMSESRAWSKSLCCWDCATSQVWRVPGAVWAFWEIRWAERNKWEFFLHSQLLIPFLIPTAGGVKDGMLSLPSHTLGLADPGWESQFGSAFFLIYSCAEIKDCTANSLHSLGADVNFGLSSSLLCCWSLCAVYLFTSAYLCIIIYESSSSSSWRGWNTGKGQGLFILYTK